MERCSHEGCEMSVLDRGYCIKHYKSTTCTVIWTVVNTVYFDDGTNEIYGYMVKNEDNPKPKIISSKTATKLTLKGEIRVADRQELSFCSVGRDFAEESID